jgi:alcohol dehydrogenase (cytochrome c)
LYSDSVVALNGDTGELEWYFQFTPGDPYDYDAVQVPVLVDLDLEAISSGKLMLWGNRNGFFYVLDRVTGEFISGKPFVRVNWASGLDEAGRPIATPQPAGAVTYPCVAGGTNWYSPSYSPSTELFYVSAWENCGHVFRPVEVEYQPGQRFLGGRPTDPNPGAPNRAGLDGGPINNWTDEVGNGAVLAIDPRTGDRVWQYDFTDVTQSGIMTTTTDLLFAGSREGYFQALDARTGELLWRTNLGGQIANGPMSYAIDGRQFVAVAAGHSLYVFALGEP